MSTKPKTIGMTPPHPGEFIRDEVFEPLKLTINQAAKILGVRRATLSDFVNGKAALSPGMVLRREKAFGVGMETMLRMQAWYDAKAMSRRADKIDVRRYRPTASPR